MSESCRDELLMQVPAISSSVMEDSYLDLIKLALSCALSAKESRPDVLVVHEKVHKTFQLLKKMQLEEASINESD